MNRCLSHDSQPPRPPCCLPQRPSAAAEECWVFLGTYTGGSNGSKGIYRAKFDAATGKLGEPELAAEMGSPSFVAIHPNGKFLYAVGEGGGKDGGAVVAFALDAKSGTAHQAKREQERRSRPVSYRRQPKWRIRGGRQLRRRQHGPVQTRRGRQDRRSHRLRSAQGEGLNAGRQGKPHAHCCAFSPIDTVLTVDLGIDKVKLFRISSGKGLVEDARKTTWPCPPAAARGTWPSAEETRSTSAANSIRP